MPPKTRAPEEWIAFLLALNDHTPNFKPDWNGFAQSTGLYKSGKFVRQAYMELRKKYVNEEWSNTGSDVAVPETPKTPGGKARKIPTKTNAPPKTPSGKKRGFESYDITSVGAEEDAEIASSKAQKVPKIEIEDDGEEDEDNDDCEIVVSPSRKVVKAELENGGSSHVKGDEKQYVNLADVEVTVQDDGE